MKSMRNFLKSGDYVIPEPICVKMELRYNDKGAIDNVRVGTSYSKMSDETAKLINSVKKNKTTPTTIPLKHGATHVLGLLYCKSKNWMNITKSGKVPDVLVDDYIERFENDPDSFEFHAVNVKSMSAMFTNLISIRDWLSVARFKMPHGMIAPANVNMGFIDTITKSAMYKFDDRPVMGVTVYRGNEVYDYSLDLVQYKVNNVDTYLLDSGQVVSKITYDGGECEHGYEDVMEYNIQKGGLIVEYPETKKIVYCEVKNNRKGDVPNHITCDVCGAWIDVIPKVQTYCKNEVCLSKQYDAAVSMLSTLNLPVMTFEVFKQYAKDKQIVNLVDILDLPEYEKLPLEYDLYTLLRAGVPVYAAPSDDVIKQLVIECRKSRVNLDYILTYPNKILTDYGLNPVLARKLYDWLIVDFNVATLRALLDHPRMNIIEEIRKFDGAPMFRGKQFVITGKFVTGTQDDIRNIIQSYRGEVVRKLNKTVSCVLVGGTKENINGALIREAREHNIPVFDELDFFEKYKINEDLAQLAHC